MAPSPPPLSRSYDLMFRVEHRGEGVIDIWTLQRHPGERYVALGVTLAELGQLDTASPEVLQPLLGGILETIISGMWRVEEAESVPTHPSPEAAITGFHERARAELSKP